jgi:hypothetical protein
LAHTSKQHFCSKLGEQVEELHVTSRDEVLDSLSTDSGMLTRTTDLRRHWNFIERIEIRDGKLMWHMGKHQESPHGLIFDGNLARRAIHFRQQAEHDGRGVLDEFIELADLRDGRILEFANTWGVLEICHHHLPWLHGIPHEILRVPVVTRRRKTPQPCVPLQAEPLEVWRFFSRQAKALLRIAAMLEQDCLGLAEDWRVVVWDRVSLRPTVAAHRDCWGLAVDSWLTLGDVRPTLDSLNQRITWDRTDLFGELAVQIALASVRSLGQVHCAACGKSYAPKKLIARGGVHYCNEPKCQKIAAATRSARYREKRGDPDREKTSARKLRFRGVFDSHTDDPLCS